VACSRTAVILTIDSRIIKYLDIFIKTESKCLYIFAKVEHFSTAAESKHAYNVN